MKDSNHVNEFNIPANITTRAHTTSLSVLGESDECECLLSRTIILKASL
jgi:hypothetical protein